MALVLLASPTTYLADSNNYFAGNAPYLAVAHHREQADVVVRPSAALVEVGQKLLQLLRWMPRRQFAGANQPHTTKTLVDSTGKYLEVQFPPLATLSSHPYRCIKKRCFMHTDDDVT